MPVALWEVASGFDPILERRLVPATEAGLFGHGDVRAGARGAGARGITVRVERFSGPLGPPGTAPPADRNDYSLRVFGKPW